MAEIRWGLIGLAGLAGIGGLYQARAGAAAAGAIQRTGIVASVEAARQAKRVEALIPALKLQALQQHNEIVSQYRDWSDMADATISYMGRDDRSVQAIRKRVADETAKTVSRNVTQMALEEAKVMREAASLSANALNERMTADIESSIRVRQNKAQTISTGLSMFASML